MKTSALALAILLALGTIGLRAQDEPNLIPDVVDPAKLVPILPEPPSGWTAEKAEGSSDDVGGFKITNVHRDYQKGESADSPKAVINILDSVANPDYVENVTGAWQDSPETAEGYTKRILIEGNPGFEAYEKDEKHASLWVIVAKR